MKDLIELRQEIDEIDQQMVELFEKRMGVSAEVARYKIANGKKVFDKEREHEKLTKLKAMAHNDFNRHGVEELFQQIMSMSRKLQYQLLAKNGVVGRLPFIAVEGIEKSRVPRGACHLSRSTIATGKISGSCTRALRVRTAMQRCGLISAAM